jgi:hypothetical protein
MQVLKQTCGMGRVVHVNIDDPVQVDALFEAILARKSHDEVDAIVRQHRSPEQIRRDNAQAQADHERERNEGWSVRR